MIEDMSEVILFDIDNTLIDTKKLMNSYIKPALFELVRGAKDEFQQTCDEYWQTLEKPTLFDPHAFVLHLQDHYHADLLVLTSRMYNPVFYQQSLFSEVKDTLQKLSSRYTLGIFSEGNVSFQKRKLELSDIRQFFNDDVMFITDDKANHDFLAPLPKSIVVEDRLNFIQSLQKYDQFQPVWLNRDQHEELMGVQTIKKLSELSTLLTE